MARTSSAKSIKDRNRSVTYESFDEESKRDAAARRKAGTGRTFTRGVSRRAR